MNVILPQLDNLKLTTYRNLKLTCKDLEIRFNDEQLLQVLKIYFPGFGENISQDPKMACREIYDCYRLQSNIEKGIYAAEQIVSKKVEFEDLCILPKNDLCVIPCEDYARLWNRTTNEYAILNTIHVIAISKKTALFKENQGDVFIIFDRETKKEFSIPIEPYDLRIGLNDEHFVIQDIYGNLRAWDLATKTFNTFRHNIPGNSRLQWLQMPIHDGHFYSAPLQVDPNNVEICKQIAVLDLKTGSSSASLKHTTFVSAFEIENDFLYSYTTNEIYVWNLKTYECIKKWPFKYEYDLFAIYSEYLFLRKPYCNHFVIFDTKSGACTANICYDSSYGMSSNLHFNGKSLVSTQKVDASLTILNFAASDMAIFQQIANAIEKSSNDDDIPNETKRLLNKTPPQITALFMEKAETLTENDTIKTFYQHLVSVIRAHYSENNPQLASIS